MSSTVDPKTDELRFLENGLFGAEHGIVVAASRTKAGLLRWMRTIYPDAVRKRSQEGPDELYFEDANAREWYRCERVDRCPLVV